MYGKSQQINILINRVNPNCIVRNSNKSLMKFHQIDLYNSNTNHHNQQCHEILAHCSQLFIYISANFSCIFKSYKWSQLQRCWDYVKSVKYKTLLMISWLIWTKTLSEPFCINEHKKYKHGKYLKLIRSID